jgi:hypothetical protein
VTKRREPPPPPATPKPRRAARSSTKTASTKTAAPEPAPTPTLLASAQSSDAPKAPKSGRPPRALPVLVDVADLPVEETALSARWPEAVLALSDDERKARVRAGLDTVLLDDVQADGTRRTRGFVKVVLRVPLHHPQARVYGVFVEVDRDGYRALQQAFKTKERARVAGRLATRLPFLDDAYGTRVDVEEDGGDRRARVIDADSPLLVHGPQVGPRASSRR